ncbi:basic leucine zipper 4-like [Vicia villosa]|uniref:basic leucine zipper 4-like n=1 Tax=Vicia villosa TaxID=3911 RepID=UPI00273C29EB|nr:basic leucine zipper 4-like [Vicia villosa]
MLSTLPPSDPFLDHPFSAGFPPWDFHDLFSDDLESTTPITITSTSGSDEPNQPHEKRKPDSDEPNHRSVVIDERKRRRMLSNRESARRSRMRKQRHVENLRNQLNKCRIENRELKNRLQFIVFHYNRIRTENEWLRSERTVLNQRINNYTQILVYQQFQFQPFSTAWTCNTTTVE